MSTPDKILELLKDGKWRKLREIGMSIGLRMEELEEVVGFFVEYRFVQLDRKQRRVRLTPSVLEFFAKTAGVC